MQKVEDGFGYYGAITETNDGDHIQCHICGYYYGNLGAHVRFKHGINPRDYKITHGLRIKDGLLSPTKRREAQERYEKYTRKSPEEMKEMSLKGAAVKKSRGVKSGGDQWTAQTRNEKGLCREQTIAKLQHLAATNNGVVTQVMTEKEYGYGFRYVIDTWFGSWTNGLKAAGLPTDQERIQAAKQERQAQAITAIQAFYEREGRSPLHSDFKADPELVSPWVITKLFGSLNRARVAAEVPAIMYVGRSWIEVWPGDEVKGTVPSTSRGAA
jgi:hypothetical protein